MGRRVAHRLDGLAFATFKTQFELGLVPYLAAWTAHRRCSRGRGVAERLASRKGIQHYEPPLGPLPVTLDLDQVSHPLVREADVEKKGARVLNNFWRRLLG